MKKLILLSILIIPLFASTSIEEYTINGTVRDELGEPLFDASIIIKGTTTAVQSDLDGRFFVKSPSACAELVITYPGLAILEVEACTGKENEFVVWKSTSLPEESSLSKPRIITGDDIKNLPTRRIGSIASIIYCFPLVEVDNREEIIKLKESNADATTYYVDGVKVAKVEALAIPEKNMKIVTIIERGSTPSTIDHNREKELANRIELIRSKAQLKQK